MTQQNKGKSMSLEQNVSNTIPWRPIPAPETFEAMLSQHLKPLRRLVAGRVDRFEDADDVVQQTLLLGLSHFGQFRHESSLGTWLCRIAINVIRGRHRRPDHTRTVFMDPKTLESVDSRDGRPSPLSTLEKQEEHSALYQAIEKLPAIYRTVVELRDLQGLSVNETARKLHLTKAALKSRHHRGRALLSKIMAENNTARSLFLSRAGSRSRPKKGPNVDLRQSPLSESALIYGRSDAAYAHVDPIVGSCFSHVEAWHSAANNA
jgi:RNA polymerase sigma-70 factor (ECF subfamily)